MRSFLIAASVCLMALNFSGCACTTGSCGDLATGSSLSGGCGGDCTTCQSPCEDQCGTCESCRPQLAGRLRGRLASANTCDCGGPVGQCGCSAGPMSKLGSRLGGRLGDCGGNCGGDCGGSCGAADCGCGADVSAPAPMMSGCDSCGDTGCNGACGGGRGLGMRLFDRGSACASTGCDGNCGGACETRLRGGSGMLSGLMSRTRGALGGCGVAGCGQNGAVCDGCRNGLLAGRGMLGGGGGLMAGRGVGACGVEGCGMGGQLCDGCRGGLLANRGMGLGAGGGCGVEGCGLGGKLCSRCRGGGLLGGKVAGCGRFGCGFGGKLCGHCRGIATGGSIPHRQPQPSAAGGAPTYVYPYYTTRAPRDFLMDNPPSIGY